MSGADFAADERLLRAIIESPAGKAAVAEGHAQAAAHRATALKVMQAAIVVQAQVQATVATKLGAAREAVDKAHRVWREKLAALHALDIEMATASHLIEAAERGARRAPARLRARAARRASGSGSRRPAPRSSPADSRPPSPA